MIDKSEHLQLYAICAKNIKIIIFWWVLIFISVFIVVTEDYYGGNEKIKVFSNRKKAEKYRKSINNKELNVIILEKQIE